jgi:hypothetical protein
MTHCERLGIDPAGTRARPGEPFDSLSCKEAAVTPAPCSRIACTLPVRKEHATP